MIEEIDLAQLLDTALQQCELAPRDAPQLAQLIDLARALETSAASVAPTPQFRRAARQRLLTRTATSTSYLRNHPRPIRERIARWGARFVAGLGAFAALGTAAATASASALPGDPLYALKQASEAVAIGMAPTDSARQEVLLTQAAVRLDETTRLLEQGRGADALAEVGRYDAVIDRVASDAPAAPALQAHLEANHSRLTQLLETAPPQARPGLQRALDATQRGLAHRQSAQGTEASLAEPTDVRAHPDVMRRPVEATPLASSSEGSASLEASVAATEARGRSAAVHAEQPEVPRPASSSEGSAALEASVAATEAAGRSAAVHAEQPEAPRPAPDGRENTDANSKTPDVARANGDGASNSDGNANIQRNSTANSRPPASGATQDHTTGRRPR